MKAFNSSLVAVHRYQIIVVCGVEQLPEFLDEAVYTVDTVRIPRFGLFYRAEEHFVHTKRVGTVFLDNHIRIDYVEHGFTHLFNSPSADVFAIFQDKLSIVIFRTPCFEGFDIQNIVGYDIHIYMERSSSYWSFRFSDTNVLVSLMRYTKLLRP